MQRLLLVSGALVTSLAAAPAMQAPALDRLVGRAGQYVERYLDVATTLVAEEVYKQQLLARTRRVSAGDQLAGGRWVLEVVDQRELRSDVALLRVGGLAEWRIHRDVYAVDGRPVRERADRLARLFDQAAEAALVQGREIAEESARYNIGTLGRTLNEPGLPLVFLQKSLRARFEFTLDRQDRGAGPNVWIVRYLETARPTVFRHNETVDNASAGRLWIDADTGMVARTEHTVTPRGFRATFTTTFRAHERYGVSLPIDMRESWVSNNSGVEGTATYGQYRQFEVSTEESQRRP